MKNSLIKKSFYALLAFAFIFTSCDNNEVNAPVTGSVLILHEGSFGSANATVGSYNPLDQTYNPAAYSNANGGFIGDVQQSATVKDGQIYSILNGSNAIQTFDAETFLAGDRITDDRIDKPRYMSISGNTGYLSNWGPYDENFSLTDSNILMIDLQSNSVTGIIETGEYTENVFIQGDKLLVSRANFDGTISNLTVININTEQVVADIEMPAGPSEILAAADGSVWLVCTSGALVKLNTDLTGIEATVDLGDAVLGDIDLYADEIYFYQQATSTVKKLAVSNSGLSSFISNVELAIPYALGVDPNSGEVYLADGVDYAGEGKVLRYTSEGVLVEEFVSGILPTQFLFN